MLKKLMEMIIDNDNKSLPKLLLLNRLVVECLKLSTLFSSASIFYYKMP